MVYLPYKFHIIFNLLYIFWFISLLSFLRHLCPGSHDQTTSAPYTHSPFPLHYTSSKLIHSYILNTLTSFPKSLTRFMFSTQHKLSSIHQVTSQALMGCVMRELGLSAPDMEEQQDMITFLWGIQTLQMSQALLVCILHTFFSFSLSNMRELHFLAHLFTSSPLLARLHVIRLICG